jgi:hypothetical protein
MHLLRQQNARAVINRLYCRVQVRNQQDPSTGSFDGSKLANGEWFPVVRCVYQVLKISIS